MTDSEFDIIKQYFTFTDVRGDVVLAGGDDCAILAPVENRRLLVTTDTLISGVHFPEDASAEDIAYKSVMVNLSDLAAMGAEPAWLTLAISLPEIDHVWLKAFSDQLSVLLSEYNISLIGGDTTRGQLSVTIQAIGLAEEDLILRRDCAKPGEKIFVTGTLGDAAIGLRALASGQPADQLKPCVEKLNRPQARLDFARALSNISRCAIDISDGLIADLDHILKASHCGARLMLEDIPLSDAARYYFEHYYKNTIDWSMVLAGGDDYELCFTVSENAVTELEELADEYHLRVSCIGTVTDTGDLSVKNVDGSQLDIGRSGFNHFL
jgi:thiamine-monophosphate kinase